MTEPFELTAEEMVDILGRCKRGQNRYEVVAQEAQRKLWKYWNEPCTDTPSHVLRYKCETCRKRLQAALGEKK
ncbi:MAG: hypothetical protein WC455_15360 [Dehalococcoidia bacterium]|jgi:hypothetical protein